jgi:hypothetical protein
LQVNAQLRGLITNLPEDDEDNLIVERTTTITSISALLPPNSIIEMARLDRENRDRKRQSQSPNEGATLTLSKQTPPQPSR